MIDKLWNKFYSSGKIDDYLNYKNTSYDGGDESEPQNFGDSDKREYNQGKRQSFDDSYE